jgi:hypothetical protein
MNSETGFIVSKKGAGSNRLQADFGIRAEKYGRAGSSEPALSLYSDRTQAVEPNRAEYEGEDEYDSGTKPLSEEMVAWFKRRL